MKISYNWLKWYIPDAPDAEKLADIFTYHVAEVESFEKLPAGDFVFDINILPNRAHDLLSHQGIARELASLLNIKYVDPTPKYKIPPPAGGSEPTKLKIEITTKKDRRHMGRIVRNVKVGPSPEWVVNHLTSIGQRSINNIVDATNITMFDCGQPTHAFDLNKVEGARLNIRDAKSGERITLLTGEEKELKDGMIAICDDAGNILDTGIKGGKHAEITTLTTDLILEADNFDPVFARKTGQALNILTDARKRFENDLSPELIPYAMRELSALILEMCPNAIFEEIVDTYPQKQLQRKLVFSAERISKILGLEVSSEKIEEILKRYNFEYRPLPSLPLDKGEEKGGGFELTVPSMRFDLVFEEDIAEEIGRVLGYDKVNEVVPKINFKPKVNETYAKICWVRHKLLSEGYGEVMTYAFAERGEVEVLQSASDKKFLRTNLADGIKESIKLNKINAPLLGLKEIKVFEIGTVFLQDKPARQPALAKAKLLLAGDAFSIADEGGEEMHVCYGDKKNIREVSLMDFCKDMPPEFKLESRSYNLEAKFKMWSLFPFITRDIAVWVPEYVSGEEIVKIIREHMGGLVVRGPEIFDEFKKDGKISYAFRLVFQSYDHTLTDAEINDLMTKITNKIKDNNGWQVR